MIRINLLGQARPKAPRRAVPLEATLQIVFFVAVLAAAVGFLFIHWGLMNRDVKKVQGEITRLHSEKARLEEFKQQLDSFERQKGVVQQRSAVFEELQRMPT